MVLRRFLTLCVKKTAMKSLSPNILIKGISLNEVCFITTEDYDEL